MSEPSNFGLRAGNRVVVVQALKFSGAGVLTGQRYGLVGEFREGAQKPRSQPGLAVRRVKGQNGCLDRRDSGARFLRF